MGVPPTSSGGTLTTSVPTMLSMGDIWNLLHTGKDIFSGKTTGHEGLVFNLQPILGGVLQCAGKDPSVCHDGKRESAASSHYGAVATLERVAEDRVSRAQCEHMGSIEAKCRLRNELLLLAGIGRDRRVQTGTGCFNGQRPQISFEQRSRPGMCQTQF